jgi:hypothetical protein
MRDRVAGFGGHASSDDDARRIGPLRALCAALAVSLCVLAASAASASAAQVLDQSQTSGSPGIGVGPNQSAAQIYTAGITGALTEVDLYIGEYGSGVAGPIDVSIESVTPSGQPDGTSLFGAAYDPSQGLGWVIVPISPGVPQIAGTRYAIVITAPNGGLVDSEQSYFTLGTDFASIAGMDALDQGIFCASWCGVNPYLNGAYEFKTWVTPPPPVTTITLTPSSPAPSGWYTGPVNVAVSATDAGSGVADTRCQLDGTLPGSFTAILDSCAFSGVGANVTTQGAHTVYAASADNAGNQESVESATFKIDSVAPTSTITLTPSAPNGNKGWYTEPVKVSVSASDPTPGSGLANAECELDPASAPLSYAGLSSGCPYAAPGATISSEGDHVVYAASVDNAGNTETPESAALKIDTTPPRVTFAGTGTYTVAQTVDVTCTATDPAPAVGPGPASGVAGTPCASPLASGPAYDFAIGLNPVAVTVGDNAGNSTHATSSFTIGVTATSLCTLQGQLIDGSAAYHALPTLARKLVDLLAGAGCSALTPLITRTRAAVVLYDALISSETSAGWLTKTQAAMLTKLAADL